jgi:hypothetical protein
VARLPQRVRNFPKVRIIVMQDLKKQVVVTNSTESMLEKVNISCAMDIMDIMKRI